MRVVGTWLQARAKDIAAALLGLMFLAFIVQIFFRYVLNYPLGWTLEACLTFWLWGVFWGAAFVLEDRDHVRFDMVLAACSPPVQRVMGFCSSAAIALAFAVSMPATIDYVTFYKIKSSATLGIRLDLVFSIYVLFALSMVTQHTLRCWRLLRGRSPDPQTDARTPGA